MTVSTNDNKIIYAGNGTTVAFPVPFLFYDDAHIVVRIKKDETVTDCVRGVDYSIAGAGDGNGGTVTFAVAPDNGTQVAILRDVPFVQNTQYLDGDPLPAELLERNLDILTMQTQQLKEQADRAVSLDTFSSSNPSQIVGKIEGLYDDRDKLITVAEHIAAVDVCSDNIEAIKSAPTYAADAHASLTASLLAEASAADSRDKASASESSAVVSRNKAAASENKAREYALQAVRRNVGDVFYTTRSDDALNGAVEADGAVYQCADFAGENAVPALLAAGKLPYVGMADFDACVAANGACRAFGWDGAGAAVFKVPKLSDVYIQAGTAASAGEFVGESLPQHAHGFSITVADNENSVGYVGWEGAGNKYTFDSATGGANDPVYQDGAKVRPDSVRYRAMVQIATGAGEEALALCTSVLASVADLELNKANADAGNFTAAGKSVLSGFGMPSDTHVDLTAGASGSTYTAPANGWFSVYNASGQSNSVQLYNQTKKIGICNAGITGFTDGMTFVPAAKDDVVMLKYTGAFNSLKTGWFRFIYAQGEQNV